MNTHALRTLALVGILTLVVAASAQAQFRSDTLIVDIPFPFRINEAVLPAGTYTVKPIPRTSSFLVQNSTSRKAAIALTAATLQASRQRPEAKLVFRRYREQYFLGQIWTPEHPSGRQVPTSGAERQIERELKQVKDGGDRVAGGAAPAELVTVLVRR